MTNLNEDLNSKLGKVIGVGTEKRCYLNLYDNGRCLKISDKKNAAQIKREIKYFKFLNKRKIDAPFIPKFYGEFETDNLIGYEQECFLEIMQGGVCTRACPLSEYILHSNYSENEIKQRLEEEIKKVMIDKNIICCDLHEGNVYFVEQNSTKKFVVIDGFGTTEFIPISQYLTFFCKKKIERQWLKFEERLKKFFNNVNKIHE